MPSWNDVLNELSLVGGALDVVRRKYLAKLHEETGRNVIAYYSGWIQKPGAAGASINDDDKNALMATIHKLDRSQGLDLILHTPGGDLAATESIVDYLHRMFGHDIRAIIPQIAMSAGTMIACSTKEIILGKQSNIGPIDPQFAGIPAHGVIEEINRVFREAKKDPSRVDVWKFIIGKYHPTFIGECEKAIALADKMVSQWLQDVMFKGEPNADKKAKKVVRSLNNHKETKTHARHISIDQAKSFGLKIKDLESDQSLQDIVLTVHHCFMHTLANTPTIKIVENHLGNAMIIRVAQQ